MTTLQPGQPTDDIPHEVELVRATQIARGVTLFTRDGSHTGNAIVVGKASPPSAAADYLKQTGQGFWEVETDFGNRMQLCDNEIHELFTLGRQQTYDSWWDARLELIRQALEEEPKCTGPSSTS